MPQPDLSANIGDHQTEAAVGATLAMSAEVFTPKPVPGAPDHVVAIGGQITSVEDHLKAPLRTRGTVTALTAEGLITYVRRHQLEETELYVDADAARFVAVLNSAGPSGGSDGQLEGSLPGDTAWGDHRAELTLQPTDAWAHWTGADGEWMDQETMALHVETGLPEITAPASATMLEVVSSLSATSSAEFGQSIRLSSGQRQLRYVETIDGKAGTSGQLEIPETFTLQLPVFRGQEFAQELTARFRFRVQGGHLRMAYQLVRPMDAWRAEVDGIVGTILAALPATLPLIHGRPRAARA